MSNRQQKHKHVNQRDVALRLLPNATRVHEETVQLVPCLGGCGQLVLRAQGECRRCRRQRVRAGKRRLARLLRTQRRAA